MNFVTDELLYALPIVSIARNCQMKITREFMGNATMQMDMGITTRNSPI